MVDTYIILTEEEKQLLDDSIIVNCKNNGTLCHAIYYTSKSRQVP